jgi:hypothetical protein
MSDAGNSEQVEGSEDASYIPNLQGNIYMTPTGGSHTTFLVGQSPAAVDWTQGATPLASAQFGLAHQPRIPMPPPPQITALNPGQNSIPLFGSWYSASVEWTYAGASGAGTFSWGTAGLPTGAGGANIVSNIVGAQQGVYEIAFGAQPTACLLSFNITPSQGFMGPNLVLVTVDGQYIGALADGTSVVINGTVLSLTIDFRGDTVTQLQVGYTLQYQW